MDIDWLFEISGLPIKSKQRSNIPKNAIYPQLTKTEDKKLLQDEVQSIYLLSVLNETTTNLSTYETEDDYYNEIFFIHVLMRERDKENKVFNILSSVFPYPIIVVFTVDELSMIYTGKYEKRKLNDVPSVKKLDAYPSKSYTTHDLVQLFKKLYLNELKQTNLKELYEWIQNNILGDSLQEKQNTTEAVLLTVDEQDEINQLEKDIQKLTKEVRKETQLNKRIPLQLKLNEKKKRLKEIIERGE